MVYQNVSVILGQCYVFSSLLQGQILFANSVELHETAHNELSTLDPHCLPVWTGFMAKTSLLQIGVLAINSE